MRRNKTILAGTLLVVVLLATPALAQQPQPINPRIPPLPPIIEQFPLPERIPAPILQTEPAPEIVPRLPERVFIPSGTRIAVVLETPMSTRISKTGQVVSFRTTEPLRLDDQLEIPPETSFAGSVVEAKRPGRFGRAGKLRIKVERVELMNGDHASVVARLESRDLNGQGQLSDHSRVADLYNLGVWTLQGTLIGSQIKGGKGAAVGAGAGAAVALIMMASKRGPDVYLEPGMPFQVIVDAPVELDGKSVYAAQKEYERAQAATGGGGRVGPITPDENHGTLDRTRPEVKHRPKK